jgi:hypothetical protein
MPSFNFIEVARQLESSPKQLDHWLQLGGFRFSRTKTVLLAHPVYKKLQAHLSIGRSCGFVPLASTNSNILKSELAVITKHADRIAERLEQLQEELRQCEAELTYGHQLPHFITATNRHLAEIRKSYVDRKLMHMLHLHSDFKQLSAESKSAEAALATFSPAALEQQQQVRQRLQEQQAQARDIQDVIDQLQAKIVAQKRPAHPTSQRLVSFMERISASLQSYSEPTVSLQQTSLVTIQWEDVQFDEGALIFRYCDLWLPRYHFPQSRRYLNLIKQHYTFRQAPPLQVRLHLRTVLEVLNPEVVLYYIQFLSNTGQLLDVPTDPSSDNVAQRFARCTKQYYRTHLPNLFRKQSLRFLCEIMDEETCIIPTPELVINSTGYRTVHDSFLFTYKSHFSAYIMWESTEEGKATYIFKTPCSTLNQSLQTIFNYIVNDTVNKRSTLIRSQALRQQLGMVAWITHTSYSEWRQQIRRSMALIPDNYRYTVMA